MRGRQRINVIIAGIVSAAASGAITAFALGVAWRAAATVWPALSVSAIEPRLAAGAVAGALVLDAAGARWRRLAALSTRRQVPRLWSTVFAPVTTAFLYGTRLGVGPLTILPTWLWWAAVVIGAAVGPVEAAAVGATFGATRLAVVVVASLWVEGAASSRVARLTALRRGAASVLSGVALATAGVASVATGDPSPLGGGTAATAATGVGPAEQAPSAPAVAASPSLPPADPDNDPLASLLPVDLPGDFDPLAPAEQGLGPIDLAEAAAAEADPEAERALLETRGFEHGYGRAWQRDDGMVAYAMVYRFGQADQAALYRTDGFITLESRGATLYDVAAVPDARGFSQVDRRPDGTLVSHGVAWVDAQHFFLVFVSGPGSTATTDAAAALAANLRQ